MSTSRFLVSLTASLALATFVWASDEPTLEQRLEKLAESLETARERAQFSGSDHIRPGGVLGIMNRRRSRLDRCPHR